MKFVFWIILFAFGGAYTNILSPFGRCRKVPHVTHMASSQLEGIWFLQLRPDIAGHNSPYSCQISYEYILSDRPGNFKKPVTTLAVYIYYASNGVTVREPVYFEFYWDPFDGVFKGQNTVDGDTITLYYYVLHLGTDERITYMCTDNPTADVDQAAVFLWTRFENPPTSVIGDAVTNITSIFYSEKNGGPHTTRSEVDKLYSVQMYKVNQMAEECDIRLFYMTGSRYLRDMYTQLH